MKTKKQIQKALRVAMGRDMSQWMINSLTPDRGYGVPIDNIWAVVEPLLFPKKK